jgi:hypothetical protein
METFYLGGEWGRMGTFYFSCVYIDVGVMGKAANVLLFYFSRRGSAAAAWGPVSVLAVVPSVHEASPRISPGLPCRDSRIRLRA